ncbi:hypothetical protein COU75_01620 [Candidatus Peregrinibacteria bacterium CG10_big_fil_rev_8_21_14_0_10_42_8]|nr:MAG: hypothetical protein COU75_01620 [Candidatus Peregrinibacteria bacterium CG10_big_fil_rev_8_21_14_0_10_42_8]
MKYLRKMFPEGILFLMTAIRAIVARFSPEYSDLVIEKVLSKYPFEFCGIISSGKPRFFSSIPQDRQEWFVSSDIRGCHYDDVDWNTLAPLDELLIESMRECEAIFMGLMCRLEWKTQISYEERKKMYLRHLRFWNDYFDRQKINLYLSAWLPHEIPDIIPYYLCKQRGIPVICFDVSTERDTSFIVHGYEDSAVQLGERYEALLKEYAKKDISEISLNKQFTERFNALTKPSGQKPPLQNQKYPLYFDHLKELLQRKPLHILQFGMRYCTPSGIIRALSAWKRRRVIARNNAFYDKNAVALDPNHRFVYFALHFQPEMSTIPMGGGFGDQVLVAQLLSKYLPDDVLIYVKEHPRESSWLYRSEQFYQSFLDIKNVRLISRDTDSFALREHCEAVATITGSVGFEALFRSKPVLMFGHRFYQYSKGVFLIRTHDDCRRAVQAIFIDGQKPSLKESKLFLKAIEETRVHGLVNPWDRKVSHLSDEEHVVACSEAILAELRIIL